MQTVDLRPLGLITKPNPLGLPPGAMSRAQNMLLERDGLAQKRRGFLRAQQAGGPIHRGFVFDSSIWANWGTTTTASAFGNAGVTTFSALSGTFTNSLQYRMHEAIALGNCYFTTDEGVHRLEPTSHACGFAGGVHSIGIDKSGPAALLVAGTMLTDQKQVAYRVVWYIKDANGTSIFGDVGPRVVVPNSALSTGYSAGNARNVVVRVLIPKDVNTGSTALTTSHYFRIYRSKQVAVTQQPSEDLQLVYEAQPTAGQITAGFVDVTDSTPETLLGDFIYTSPNAGDNDSIRDLPGILQQNAQPPLARDLAYWRDCLWYGNVRSRYYLNLTILSVTAGVGLSVGDTLTIAGQTYTGVVGAPAAATDFTVVTAGTASQNIEATALNLVQAINKNTSNTTIWAAYLSGPNELPGKLYLEARTHSATVFTAIASAHTTAYQPQLGAAVSAAQDTWANGLAFSKPRQPDAVPIVNYERIGPSDATLLRIFPLRDSLYLFTDAGLYRVTGTDPSSFDIELVDSSCRLLARETVGVVDDRLYAWTYQGVAEISFEGVKYVSDDIEPTLQEEIRRGGIAPGLTWYSFGFGWQGEHKYVLGTLLNTGDKQCGYFWVFDTRTRRWAGPWMIGDGAEGRSFALVHPTDQLVYMFEAGNAGDGYMFSERKARTSADYQDGLRDGTTIAITWRGTMVVQTARNPAAAKQWSEVGLLWGDNAPTTLAVLTSSELDAGGTANVSNAGNKLTRVPVHQGAARCARLLIDVTHSVASEGLDLAGVSLMFREYGNRVQR